LTRLSSTISALEGELIVESRPGEGARLEIAFR
jgi:hypothetical protein